MLQVLRASSKMKRCGFCNKMQLKMEEDSLMERLIFSELMCTEKISIPGGLSIHCALIDRIPADSKKIMFLSVSCKKGALSTLLQWSSGLGHSFLNKLENWLLPELNSNYCESCYNWMDPPNFHKNVQGLLNCILTHSACHYSGHITQHMECVWLCGCDVWHRKHTLKDCKFKLGQLSLLTV